MLEGRRTVALLLVGGAGKRLWPVSHEDCPKQFLKLFSSRSLFQATLLRIAPVVDDVVVVVGQAHAAMVVEQAAEIGLPAPRLLIEPIRRDSAPAIAAGAAWIRRHIDPEALVAVLPADHYIPEVDAFAAALERGAQVAAQGWLVTFGIRPTSPTSEYGYIQRGGGLDGPGLGFGYRIAKFHEKPTREVAQGYLRDGGYDWNSGIFLFGVQSFAGEALRHMPDIWHSAVAAVETAQEAELGLVLEADAFAKARKSAIDYALFEKSDRVAVVPVGFEWHDIGTWASAYEAFAATKGGNLVLGDALVEDVSGSLVVADGVKIVVCGLENVVVVASPQGTLVAPRARAAEIKRLLGG
jgi:mannose-1-phosphate guanylyltransferase / mannose-6-phosphate isomerase